MENDADTGSEEIIEMFCELCKRKGKTRTADGFCVECVRYLCAKCLAYHTEFLPDHIQQDKKNMPQDVCLQQCPGHAEEIIKFYCTGCNAFFCCLCKKKDHDECEDVNHLPHLVCQLEKGKEFQEFKSEMEILDGETKNIESGIETDKESIELISRKALLEIESTRKRFLEQLNGGFDKLITEVMTVKDNDKKAIESNSSKLSKMKSQMRMTKLDIEKMQREARRCELFMYMKGAESNRKTFQDDLNKMKERTIKRFDIQMKDFGSLFGKDLQLGKLHWEDVQTKSRQSKSTNKAGCEVMESSDTKTSMAKRAFGQNVTTKVDPVQFPDVKVQKSAIANQLQRPFIKGEMWYLLYLKWFKQWKSYVGYESWDHYNVGEDSSHPGPIYNTPIFQEGTKKLKEHLIDGLDYVLVPEEGWNNLVSWYGMLDDQKSSPRRVIEEGLYKKSLKVEVYPWYLKLCENSNPDCQISKIFSRSDTVGLSVPLYQRHRLWLYTENSNVQYNGKLEQTMRVEFNIAPEKEVRLWKQYMTNMYEQLNKKDNTLQEAELYQGQEIVIEQRNTDGTWPRQDEARTNPSYD